MTDMEKMFEKMLNMEIPKEEMYEQCRNVAHKPLTNEEYIRNCSTEQLAETIAQYFYGWTTNSTPYDIILHSVVEWLKEKHE